MKKLFLILLFLICAKSFGQLDSIQHLNVVNIQSITLKKYSKGFKVMQLGDSIILHNLESFSSLLRFNSPIYIKENGAGGTSSVSFRGTNASNTAVIWNGININSINSGQSEFNAMNVSLFESIDIRSGGGSIEYGSGAVGGTIHLNNQLSFSNHLNNQIFSSFGSYNTFHNLYKLSYGNDKFSFRIGAASNQSDNDYKWLGYNLKNENGGFKNIDLSLGLAYKIGKFSKLMFYSSNYNGSRNFSGQLPNPSSAKEKYKDFYFRNLVNFNYHRNQLNHTFSLAYLSQEYQYFTDKNVATYNYGKSERLISKYTANYKISGKSNIQSFSEYESTIGYTDEMDKQNRRQFSQSMIYNQQFKNKVGLNAKVRKDFNSDYTIPLVVALGADFNPITNIFVRLNGSTNYKVPSYNDLYWPSLGNKDLIPESSEQGEFGIAFKNKHLKIDAGGFYINSKDKIVWTPNGDPNRPGVWVPINIDHIINKGLEFTMEFKIDVLEHKFSFNSNYSYTVSENQKTNELVPFIPKHLFNGNLGYSYKKISMFYQHLFNGKIFTTTDNSNDYSVPSFIIGNIGGSYNLIKTTKKQLDLGFKINNFFNEAYQVLPGRPMPNRTFNFNINYKF